MLWLYSCEKAELGFAARQSDFIGHTVNYCIVYIVFDFPKLSSSSAYHGPLTLHWLCLLFQIWVNGILPDTWLQMLEIFLNFRMQSKLTLKADLTTLISPVGTAMSPSMISVDIFQNAVRINSKNIYLKNRMLLP